MDLFGEEVLTFEQIVRLIREAVGSRARIVHVPAHLALSLLRMVGLVLRDVVLTRDELDGLMDDLLVCDSVPAGEIAFSRWIAEHGESLGTTYTSDVARQFGAAADASSGDDSKELA